MMFPRTKNKNHKKASAKSVIADLMIILNQREPSSSDNLYCTAFSVLLEMALYTHQFEMVLNLKTSISHEYPKLKVILLHSQGNAYMGLGDRRAALHHFEESYRISCELETDVGQRSLSEKLLCCMLKLQF